MSITYQSTLIVEKVNKKITPGFKNIAYRYIMPTAYRPRAALNPQQSPLTDHFPPVTDGSFR
jgi:hypothetical protein